MPKLTITDDDGTSLLESKITGPINHTLLAIAVLKAIEDMPKPRKKRERRKKAATTPVQ